MQHVQTELNIQTQLNNINYDSFHHLKLTDTMIIWQTRSHLLLHYHMLLNNKLKKYTTIIQIKTKYNEKSAQRDANTSRWL